MNKHFQALLLACAAAWSTIVWTALPAGAQQQVTPSPTAKILSLTDLEQRAKTEGLTVVKEIEIEGMMVEIDGYDAQQQKVELVLHRATGEVLSRKVKPPKHHR